MNKILVMSICSIGMLMSMTSAQAANYIINPVSSTTNNPPNSLPVTGTWKVLFNTSNWILWNVQVDWIDAGIGPVNQVPIAQQNVFGVNLMSFRFKDGLGNSVGIAGTPTGGTIPGGLWSGAGFGGAANYSTSTTGHYLKLNGSNTFKGQFMTSQAVTNGSITASLTGSSTANKNWYGTAALTPEMPGGVLLLSAFLPLGLMLRKKGTSLTSVA